MRTISGDLPRNRHQGAAFVPDLPILLQQATGDEAGPEKAFQPFGCRQVAEVGRALYGRHPGHHPLTGENRWWECIRDQQNGWQFKGTIIFEFDPPLYI